MTGTVLAICTAPEKGVQKRDRGVGRLVQGKGFEGDGHFGFAHRQVSLLDSAEIEKMRKSVPGLFHGAFAENIVTEGIDLSLLAHGDLIGAGECLLRVTQLGKECHDRCAIHEAAGDCIMPRLGIFCEVLRGGTLRNGDEIRFLPDPPPATVSVPTLSPSGTETLPGECSVSVVFDGEGRGEVRSTWGMERYWAVGRLFSMGLLGGREEIASLEIRQGEVVIRRKPDRAPAALRDALAPFPHGLSLPCEAIAREVRRLNSPGASLLDERGSPLVSIQEVDGAIAMEKAIGWALLRNVPPGRTALFVRCPLTAGVVRTAVRAGFPLLAGPGVPTADALPAAVGHIALAGSDGSGETVVYTDLPREGRTFFDNSRERG